MLVVVIWWWWKRPTKVQNLWSWDKKRVSRPLGPYVTYIHTLGRKWQKSWNLWHTYFVVIVKHYGLLDIFKWKGEVMKAGYWEVCSSRYLCKRLAGGIKRPARSLWQLWYGSWHKSLHNGLLATSPASFPATLPPIPALNTDIESPGPMCSHVYMPLHMSTHWCLAHLDLSLQSDSLSKAPFTYPNSSAFSHGGRVAF